MISYSRMSIMHPLETEMSCNLNVEFWSVCVCVCVCVCGVFFCLLFFLCVCEVGGTLQ